MHPNIELLTRFYTGLANGDIATIRACYTPDVVYSDPVFHRLEGERAIAMWDMFFSRDDAMEVTFSDLVADDTTGSGNWEAKYVFSKTGRPVHNYLHSQFVFANGHIAEHHDAFNVYRWSRMALGPIGTLAGWSPPLKSTLHRQSKALLDKHQAKMAGEGPPVPRHARTRSGSAS